MTDTRLLEPIASPVMPRLTYLNRPPARRRRKVWPLVVAGFVVPIVLLSALSGVLV